MSAPPAGTPPPGRTGPRASWLGRWRVRWRQLRESEPGRRFAEWHERRRRTRGERGLVARVVPVLVALVLLAIGAVLVFIPGPAVLFFAVGGMVLAGESRRVARALDRGELWVRRLAGRWRRK